MTDKPEPTIDELVKQMTESWAAVSKEASNISFYRRVMYNAYLLEGFAPEEALQLIKTI